MYLLDTNVCIQFLKKKSMKLVDTMKKMDPQEIALCSIVKAELLFGIYKRKSNRIVQDYEEFIRPFRSFDFDDHCIQEYAEIRQDLEEKGTPIGPNDTLIAAIARANNLILVTHNIREFQRVNALQIVDWEV